MCPYEHKLGSGSGEIGGKLWRIVETPNGPPIADETGLLRTGGDIPSVSSSAVIFRFSPVRAEPRDGDVDRAHGSGTRNRTRGSASIAESPTSIFRRRYERSWTRRALRQEGGYRPLCVIAPRLMQCGLPRVGLRLGCANNEANGRTANPAPDYK